VGCRPVTDPERTSLSGQIQAVLARLDALERHAQEREDRHVERHNQVRQEVQAISRDQREVGERIASLEAVKPQADRVARQAHEATDALHTQQGRREGREEVSETWWARLGVIAAPAGGIGGLVGATVAIVQATGG